MTTPAPAPAPEAAKVAVTGLVSGVVAGFHADVAVEESKAKTLWAKVKPYVIYAAIAVASAALGHLA